MCHKTVQNTSLHSSTAARCVKLLIPDVVEKVEELWFQMADFYDKLIPHQPKFCLNIYICVAITNERTTTYLNKKKGKEFQKQRSKQANVKPALIILLKSNYALFKLAENKTNLLDFSSKIIKKKKQQYFL